MNEHVDDWIPELVLGTLDHATRATVEVHLEHCGRCAAEVAAMGEALSLVGLALPPERPHATVRTNVLAAIVAEKGDREERTESRFGAIIDRVASFFEVTRERAKRLLALIDEPTAWTRGPAEGINLIDLQAGPRFAGADPGFVRVRPGATFPHHRHVGGELVLVIQGGFVEPDGTVYRAGGGQDLAVGTSHYFTALPGEDCILAVIIWDGLDFTPPGSTGEPEDA